MTEFKLPELGENIDQGDLVRLMISLGASVTEGQPVMELETDKAVVEVPSSVTGTVNEIRVKEGQKVKVGQVIFTVENGTGAKAKAAEAKVAKPRPRKAAAVEAKSDRKAAAEKPPRPRPPAARRSPRQPRSQPGAADFRLPELGENIEQGDLVRLMISPGSKVSEGQPVMELETDKAVVEVPSSVTGTVKEIKVKEGEKIKVGQVIFTLEGGATAQPEKAKHAPVEHISEQHEARISLAGSDPGRGKNRGASIFARSTAASGAQGIRHAGATGEGRGNGASRAGSRRASVRRLARELGVDIYEVKGAGPGGRISEDDVKAHAKSLLTSVAAAQSGHGTPLHAARPSRFHQIWESGTRLHARRAAQDGEHLWEAGPPFPT